MKGTKHYFAFISYSRRDSKIASAIWRKLESFRYPSNVERQYRPESSKYVRDIFFDRTKLECSSTSFKEGIDRALGQSRYLIVVCSANSATPNEDGKHWVNDEIATFLSYHGGDIGLVIPVLVDGDIKNLPPAIDTESIRERNNPVCLDEKDGVDAAVAQILGYVFHLPTDFLLAKLNSQRLRFFRIMAMLGIGLALVFSAMTFRMSVLKSRADRNRQAADESAREAERQAERAALNEKEAVRQAEVARRNAEIAEHERKLAAQSLDFMVDTFRLSDPLSAGQSDFQMIDAIKARIPDIARLEPWELRADVECQVGSLLYNVGLFNDATNLLYDAVSLNLDRRPDSPETAYSLYCTSWCFIDMLDFQSALDYAKRALSIYEKSERRDPLKIALACNAIGVFSLYTEESLTQARKHFSRALEIRQRELGARHLDVAVVYCNLGYLHFRGSAFELAIKAYERALEIYRHNNKSSHVGAAKAWRGLGLVYCGLKKYEKAIESFDRALEIQAKTAGRNSRGVCNLYRDIGLAYRCLGDYSNALASMKAALEIAKLIENRTHNDSAVTATREIEGHVRSIEYRIRHETGH